MGNAASNPDPSQSDTPTRTGTGTPTGTKTPTGTGTASITPNISAVESYSASASNSFSPSVSMSSSASGSSSSSASSSDSPHISQSSRLTLSTSSTVTGTPLPTVICGASSQSESVWKTHVTAGSGTYVNDMNCVTVYTTDPNKIIQFTVTYQDTEACCDFVDLYNGPSTSSARIVRIVGSVLQAPGVWVSTGNTMTVAFITDNSIIQRGVIGRVLFLDGPSHSPTSSSSVSAIPSQSLIGSRSSTGSFTLSRAPIITFTPSPSAAPSANPSDTPSPSLSSAASDDSTPTQAETPSSLVSYSETVPYTPSSQYSTSMCESDSPNVSRSNTVSSSYSYSQRATRSSSLSLTYSDSRTATISRSMRSTLTISPSSRASDRPRGPPPPIPSDLKNFSLNQLNSLFDDIAFYDPILIQGSLQKMGVAGLAKSGGEFGVSTSAFDLKMKALDTSAPASISLGSTNMDLPPLSSLGTGLAASMIQWTSNPYATSSTLTIDTPTLSLNILDSTGSQLSVKNLSAPISFSWTLNQTDPKFQTPPFYMARCDIDELYVKSGTTYTTSLNSIHSGHGKWFVPCLLDTWKPLNCTDFTTDSFKTVQCPKLNLTPECLYWNTNLSQWSSDGCIPTVSNSTMTCQCTHLTDFTSRVNAVAEGNIAIFNNAANVYSVSGLAKYAQWFGIFGGIAGMTVLLGILSMRIDNVTTKRYVKELCHDTTIQRVFENAPNSAVYVYDKGSTRRCTKKRQPIKKPAQDTQMNLCQRIFQQHGRLQFLFRYDPRLARIFRLLSLFVIQYHSLFVTALLYGFTYGGSGKSSMAWYEMVILSIITSSLNIPVIKMVVDSLDVIGLKEYQYKFPLLCEEYERRAEFEKLALIYIEKDPALVHNDTDISSAINTGNNFGNEDEDNFLNTILIYLCCRKSADEDDEKKEKLQDLTRKELLIKMIKLLKRKYQGILLRDPFWSMLPCHTTQGWAFIIICTGWITWCLNYLLLFASAHEESVGEGVLISYAVSELSTVVIAQPIIIIVTYFIYKLIQRHGNRLPTWLQQYIMVITKHKIPALYYFSNPWKNTAFSPFTSQFAYSLFVRCPAAASKINESSYAPTKAILDDSESATVICEVEALYNTLQAHKKEFDTAKLIVRTI